MKSFLMCTLRLPLQYEAFFSLSFIPSSPTTSHNNKKLYDIFFCVIAFHNEFHVSRCADDVCLFSAFFSSTVSDSFVLNGLYF